MIYPLNYTDVVFPCQLLFYIIFLLDLIDSIPVVTISPGTRIIADLGDEVELECKVSFLSCDMSNTICLYCVTWMFGTNTLSDSNGVSTLLADGVSFLNRSNIMSGQAGLYSCEACVADSCYTNYSSITVQSKLISLLHLENEDSVDKICYSFF